MPGNENEKKFFNGTMLRHGFLPAHFKTAIYAGVEKKKINPRHLTEIGVHFKKIGVEAARPIIQEALVNLRKRDAAAAVQVLLLHARKAKEVQPSGTKTAPAKQTPVPLAPQVERGKKLAFLKRLRPSAKTLIAATGAAALGAGVYLAGDHYFSKPKEPAPVVKLYVHDPNVAEGEIDGGKPAGSADGGTETDGGTSASGGKSPFDPNAARRRLENSIPTFKVLKMPGVTFADKVKLFEKFFGFPKGKEHVPPGINFDATEREVQEHIDILLRIARLAFDRYEPAATRHYFDVINLGRPLEGEDLANARTIVDTHGHKAVALKFALEKWQPQLEEEKSRKALLEEIGYGPKPTKVIAPPTAKPGGKPKPTAKPETETREDRINPEIRRLRINFMTRGILEMQPGGDEKDAARAIIRAIAFGERFKAKTDSGAARAAELLLNVRRLAEKLKGTSEGEALKKALELIDAEKANSNQPK